MYIPVCHVSKRLTQSGHPASSSQPYCAALLNHCRIVGNNTESSTALMGISAGNFGFLWRRSTSVCEFIPKKWPK
eukprot:scaffold265535_cov29-Prasinocladus_malaysianus.AAC.1